MLQNFVYEGNRSQKFTVNWDSDLSHIEQLLIHGRYIHVRRKTGQRNLRLNVYPDGRITASAAKKVSQRELVKFILDRWDWVEKAFLRLQSVALENPPQQFKDGETILILGEAHQIRVIKYSGKTIKVSRAETALSVQIPEGWTDQRYIEARTRMGVIKFFRHNGSRILTERYAYWCEQTGIRGERLTLRGARTRWGSCSRSRTISLNWKLLFAPLDVMDYVIIHELSHLIHFNHGASFWTLVETFCPKYKLHRRWLKDHEARMATF